MRHTPALYDEAVVNGAFRVDVVEMDNAAELEYVKGVAEKLDKYKLCGAAITRQLHDSLVGYYAAECENDMQKAIHYLRFDGEVARQLLVLASHCLDTKVERQEEGLRSMQSVKLMWRKAQASTATGELAVAYG